MIRKYSKTCVRCPLSKRNHKYLYDKWQFNKGQNAFDLHKAIIEKLENHFWSFESGRFTQD